MKFASAISVQADGPRACQEAFDQLRGRVDPEAVDLVIAFVGAHAPDVMGELATRLQAAFPHATSIGCTAEGTLAVDREVERVPSVAILAGELPGARIKPFHAFAEDVGEITDWPAFLGCRRTDEPAFLVLGDPYAIDGVQAFLGAVNEHFPARPVIGGMASLGGRPGHNRLLLNGHLHDEGLVGLAFTGNVELEAVVSQGCRPVGTTFLVTQGEANLVKGLRNRPALERLHEVAGALPESERRLLQNGLFLGRAIDEYQSSFERGDFLIQNIIGMDDHGALAISGEVRVGTTVQFHVRDGDSADEDLREMLGSHAKKPTGQEYSGAVLFSCNGRGTRMWAQPGHDVTVLQELCGPIPVAGFFCAGELGPVGGRNFIHGFTASIGFFKPKTV